MVAARAGDGVKGEGERERRRQLGREGGREAPAGGAQAREAGRAGRFARRKKEAAGRRQGTGGREGAGRRLRHGGEGGGGREGGCPTADTHTGDGDDGQACCSQRSAVLRDAQGVAGCRKAQDRGWGTCAWGCSMSRRGRPPLSPLLSGQGNPVRPLLGLGLGQTQGLLVQQQEDLQPDTRRDFLG